MNPGIQALRPYPFERLSALLEDLEHPPQLEPIWLSIGEPKHEPPAAVLEALRAAESGYRRYPATRGTPELREAIAAWACRRWSLPALDPARQLVPCTGTREGIFSLIQAVVDLTVGERPVVALVNPFYQIYEGGALLAGAEPYYVPCPGPSLLPDLDAVPAATWDRCQLLIVCTPGNPTGAIYPRELLARLLELADRHDFVVASDECYSEVYVDESSPPPGLLEVSHALGRTDLSRAIVFESLSKRSNLPGMRSGFIAGDAAVVEPYGLYRTYHGCGMPLPHQAASAVAWRDEAHVVANRALYRAKFAAVDEALGGALDAPSPQAAFFLWAAVPGGDDEAFCRRLYREAAIVAIPGRYLSREQDGVDPGAGRVRIALVADQATCVEAAARIRQLLT